MISSGKLDKLRGNPLLHEGTGSDHIIRYEKTPIKWMDELWGIVSCENFK
jgi:hypothetical protein